MKRSIPAVVFGTIIVLSLMAFVYNSKKQSAMGMKTDRRSMAIGMGATSKAVIAYFERHDQFPTRLEQITREKLGVLGLGGELLHDAWGKDIQLHAMTSNSIEVFSFGRDGKPGGVASDTDWIYRLTNTREAPTNHAWHLQVLSAPDEEQALRLLRDHCSILLEDRDWPRFTNLTFRFSTLSK